MKAALTGTAALVGLALRRDRIRIAVWTLAIPLVVLLAAGGTKSLFPNQAAIDEAAAASQHNAAAIAFNGAAQGLDTLGGEVAFQVGAIAMVAAALMSLFMTGRLTRGDEEAGRLELVRSLPVGVHAPAAAALLTVGAMNVIVAALASAALLGEGLPAPGSLVLGTSIGAVGLFFTGIALVAAQVTENTRAVYGASGALLGLAYLVRIVGDVGDGRVSWLSPIGVGQKARPYAGERWWPLLVLLVAAALLVAVGFRLAATRDHGAGLVSARRGRATAPRSLGGPLGLALRLQRGALLGWGAGVLVTGIAYGSVATSIDSFVANNRALAEMLAGAGSGSLTDDYFATSLRILALVASGFAIQSALRLRAEESAQRADPVLASPVSRWRWAGSHLAIAMAGSAVLLLVAGLATGVSYALAGGAWSSVPRLAGAALVYAPAMWLMTGLATILFGALPAVVDVAWGVLATCFLLGFLGDVLRLPRWVLQLSPFDRTPALPAAGLAWVPLSVITLLAAVLVLAGLGALRRRDLR